MKNDYIKKYNIIFVYISLKKFNKIINLIKKIIKKKLIII